MNYLQLQIRPHFFLNCLNTIYSMAQTQLYEEIMKMSMITSNYFRYIFQNTQDLVPVKNELEHIKIIWKSKRCVTEIRSPMKFTQKKVQKTYESHQF